MIFHKKCQNEYTCDVALRNVFKTVFYVTIIITLQLNAEPPLRVGSAVICFALLQALQFASVFYSEI